MRKRRKKKAKRKRARTNLPFPPLEAASLEGLLNLSYEGLSHFDPGRGHELSPFEADEVLELLLVAP